MANLKHTSWKWTCTLSVAAIVLYAMTAVAQNATDVLSTHRSYPAHRQRAPSENCHRSSTGRTASLPGRRRLSNIAPRTCTLHRCSVPIGSAVSPRVGHLHVRLDDASWVWADASGNQIILMGLSPGPHKVALELEIQTTTPSTKARSHLSFQRRLRLPKARRRNTMKRIAFLLVAFAAVAGFVANFGPRLWTRQWRGCPPVFGITIPPGYRDYKLISVAHEAGNNNDLRAVLGNDVAIKAYREKSCRFLTALSSSGWPGVMLPPRRTTKSSVVPSLSLPALPLTFS